MWTLDESVEFIRSIHDAAFAAGYNLHLGGGVLMNGKSDHDLDILAVPRIQVREPDALPLMRAMKAAGGESIPGGFKQWEDRWHIRFGMGERIVDLIVMR